MALFMNRWFLWSGVVAVVGACAFVPGSARAEADATGVANGRLAIIDQADHFMTYGIAAIDARGVLQPLFDVASRGAATTWKVWTGRPTGDAPPSRSRP
jgi:hypothetical protein